MWVAPPLAGSLVVMAHPVIDPWRDDIAGLAPLVASNTRWLGVHLVMLALFPLSGLALAQAVSGVASRSARLARRALAVFAVVYAGFDTFAGLATGTVIQSAGAIGAAEQAVTVHAVKGLFTHPINGLLFVLGTGAWTVGAVAVAFTLWKTGAPRGPAILIAVAGPLLFLDHPPPFGPITFGAVAVALAWLCWRRRTEE
jgi:hypothetical protein